MRAYLSAALLVLAAQSIQSAPAMASGVGQVQVVGNEVTATVEVGVFRASLKITFEQALGLNATALDLSAVQLDPTSPALLSRLPNPSKITLPAQFPIQISVSPGAASNLTFAGVYEIELSTSNLVFHPDFRIFKATGGGLFQDITDFSGVGSYRVRGMSGEFSDFLILLDIRNKNSVVSQKFDALQNNLNSFAGQIESGVLSNLQAKLDSARQSYLLGLTVEAAADLEAFANEVKANEGANIPNLFRANDATTANVAGILRSGANTLIFSIRA